LLGQPHIAPLTEFVLALHQQGYDVPDFDPFDGGSLARVAFLLESPGPKAVGTRFISRDNPDQSARNMTKLLMGAGFERTDVVLWNVVPYCVSTVDRNRNASAAQVKKAAPHTAQFLKLIRELRVIVLCGKRAQIAANYLPRISNVMTLMTYHPGAMAYNRARLREHMQAVFSEAARLIGRNAASKSLF
jgi:uracil-DNA glycosylase